MKYVGIFIAEGTDTPAAYKGIVHGPFSDEELEELRLIVKRFDEQCRENHHKEHEREPGDETNYRREKDGSLTCRRCGQSAFLTPVAQRVDEQGRCIHQHIMYCPNCDRVPSSRGAPFMP